MAQEYKSGLDKTIHPYFARRFQLTVHGGCILKGLQIVIPSSLQKAVMTELHEAHTGIVKMKSVVRMYVWWPSISQDIENCPLQCQHCQQFKNNPTKAPNHTWEKPQKPWE